MTSKQVDERWMSLALSLGRRGMGQTWPNPAVGCVIVKDGTVVGRGWTKRGGRPHAETVALDQAGKFAKGATAYVTLEPCAHEGKTGPCANALAKAGVSRVVSAVEDPDPRVFGKGHEILRDAGVELETGCLSNEAARDHAGFFLNAKANRPFVTLKLAASLDGRIATESGESQWITGTDARRHAHYLRATHDAVLVGSGTARADNPSLTVRDMGIDNQPLRIIFDSRLSTDPNSKLGETAKEHPVWICHGQNAPADRQKAWDKTGAQLIPCRLDEDGRLDLTDVLEKLSELGLTRVFCEGGGQLAASLLNAKYVDRLVVYSAGLALGAEGIPSIGALSKITLKAVRRFKLEETRTIGEDILHVWS